MAEIKSAYEKAMERFSDVEPDRESLKKGEFLTKGKQLCAKSLQNEEVDLEAELQKTSEKDRALMKEGILHTLAAQISLPSSEFEIQKVAKMQEIALLISEHKEEVQLLLQKFEEISHDYIEKKQELTEQLKSQYLRVMQQQQSGAGVDPNLLHSIQSKMKELDEYYQPSIEQIKSTLVELCS